MSKLKEQQIEALNKINQLRAIKDDVELNGINNPYSTELLEMNELELKEEIEVTLKHTFLILLNIKIDEKIKTANQLLEIEEPSISNEEVIK